MALGTGVAKELVIKKETTFNEAAGASGAQRLRRIDSSLSGTKETYDSQEIREDYQIFDLRHGTRRCGGQIRGELSPGTYALPIGSALRRDFTTLSGWSAQAGDGLTAATSGGNRVFTRAGLAGTGFLTTGFKVGHVIRVSGTGDANETVNFRVVDVTETEITAAGTAGADIGAANEAAAIALPGKETFIPASGHSSDSYTIEHYFSDIDVSELFTGCRFGSLAVNMPASGLVTLDLGVTGAGFDYLGGGTAPYFTSPSAAATTGLTAAVNGSLRIGGQDVAIVTGLDVTLDLGLSGDPVVGSDTLQDIFFGTSRLTGRFTAFYQDNAFAEMFRDETEAELHVVMSLAGADPQDFVSIFLPRIKLASADASDGQRGIQRTYKFAGLRAAQGGAGVKHHPTTIVIQDSTLT
ncbi:MAG: phage tail tube protein [Alphaproteobacteria bacterium]|nr:phage tail tube protein [Alphaproteobacteria bacterium]